MSDSGKDWGYSSDEQIAQRNKERREAKARKEREQLDELDRLHAASTHGKWACRNPEGVDDDWRFACEIHNAWPAIRDRLRELQSERDHAASEMAEAIIREQALNASEERVAELLQENAELSVAH